MDSKELEKIIKLSKKHGLKKLKVDGLEMEFAEGAIQPRKRKMKDDEPIKDEKPYNEMDVLMWSVPGVS